MPIISPYEPLKGLNTESGIQNEMQRLGYTEPSSGYDEMQQATYDAMYSAGYSKNQINDWLWHEQNGQSFEDWSGSTEPERIPYATLAKIREQNTPYMKDIGFDGFGESKYDYKINSVSDLENLNDFRANQQSGFEQAVHGLAKGTAIAAGTFIDGMVSSWAGVFNIAAQAIEGNIHSLRDVGEAFVQNPISKSIVSAERAMEEYLPNYRTQHEMEHPWQHIFSVNSIFDGFLKNTGYFVGAALSGRVTATAAGKLLGAQKTRDIVAGLAAKSGNTAEQVLNGANYAAKTGKVAKDLKNVNMIADELEKVGKQIRNQKRTMGAVSLFTQTFSESRQEALNGIDRIYTPEYQRAEQARRKALDSTLQFMMEDDMSNPDDKKWFEMREVTTPDGKRSYATTLTPEGEKEYQNRIRQIEMSYENAMNNIAKEAAGAGNRLFIENAMFLTITNWLQMGKWYTGGFEANTWNGRQIVKNIIGKDGVEKAVRNKAITRGMVTQTALDNVIESFEEGGQGVLTESEGIYSHGKVNDILRNMALDHNFAQQLDIDTNEQLVNLAQAFAQGFDAYVGDPNNFQEMLYGFLTPLMLPGKIKAGKRKNGSDRMLIIPGGGIQSRVEEIRQYNQMADNVAKFINENRSRYEGLARGAAQALQYEGIQDFAMKEGNEDMYNSAKDAEILTAASMYYKAGLLEDYKSRLGALTQKENFTPEYIQQIREITKITENEKSDEQLVSEIIENTSKALKDIEQYEKIFKGLNTAFGDDIRSDVMAELAWSAARADKLERNMFEFARQAVKEINEEIDLANKKRPADKQIQHLDPMDFLIAEEDEDGNILQGSERGYKLDAFADALNDNEDIRKIANASIDFRKFMQAVNKRNEYLDTFKKLYSNPEYYSDMFAREMEKLENAYLDEFIADVNEDMSEINTIDDLKEAVDLREVDISTAQKVLDRLAGKTDDGKKKDLIKKYEKLLTKYKTIEGVLNLAKAQESAIDSKSENVAALSMMLDDFKDMFNDKEDKVESEEDIDKWIDSYGELPYKDNLTLKGQDGKAVLYAKDGNLATLQTLNSELNQAVGENPDRIDESVDNNVFYTGVDEAEVEDDNGVMQKIPATIGVNYHGKQGIIQVDDALQQYPNLSEYVLGKYKTHKRAEQIWKQIKESLKKNQDEMQRIAADKKQAPKNKDKQTVIKTDFPDWVSKFSESELRQLSKLPSDAKELPQNILEKSQEIGFDGNADIPILVEWAKQYFDKSPSTDGGSPETSDNVQKAPLAKATQTQNGTSSVFHGMMLTEYSIEQAKNDKTAGDWAITQKMKDYIRFMRDQGAYDFVNKGKLADLVKKAGSDGLGLKMIYVKNHEFEEVAGKILLATESSDGKLVVNGKRYQVVGRLDPLSSESQMSGSESGQSRDKSYSEDQKKQSIDKYNELLEKIKDKINESNKAEISQEDKTNEDQNYFVYDDEEAFVKQSDLFSGRISIIDSQESMKQVIDASDTNDRVFAIVANGSFVWENGRHVDFVDPNEYTQAARNGAVLVFVKAADGRFYPKAVRIKQFQQQDLEDTSNPRIVNLKKQIDILFDSTQSNFRRASAKAAIKHIIHFPSADSSADKKYDFNFNEDTVKIRDLSSEKATVVFASNDKTQFVKKIEELQLRYQVSLRDLGDKSSMSQLLDAGILQSNLASIYNVNGSFDIEVSNIKKREQEKPDDTKKSTKPTLEKEQIAHSTVELEFEGENMYVEYNTYEDDNGDVLLDNKMTFVINGKRYESLGKQLSPSIQISYGNLFVVTRDMLQEIARQQKSQDSESSPVSERVIVGGEFKGNLYVEQGKLVLKKPGDATFVESKTPSVDSTEKITRDVEDTSEKCNGGQNTSGSKTRRILKDLLEENDYES